MKHHLMLATGIIMLIIFGIQGLDAIAQPGIGLREAYILGGFILAGWLIKSGLAEWKHARATRRDGGE